MERKLKQSELAVFRERLRQANNGVCPICQQPLTPKESALDHCHKTGYVRNTIHLDCNILLGKIENYIFTRGIRLRDLDVLDSALKHIVPYMKATYTNNPLHPKHKTPVDKKLTQLRRRLRAAKKDETKVKIRKLIKEVQNG